MDEQELNKKLAEWAGFWYDKTTTTGLVMEIGWRNPEGKPLHGQHPSYLPNFSQSLDACFKWLVPKAIEQQNKDYGWDEKGCLNRILKDWQRRYWNSKGVLSYALALCLAIEKLIDKEIANAQTG